LHLRGRRIATLVAGLAVLGLLTWLVADWLMNRPWSAGSSDRALLTRWAPAVAAALGSIGLAGEDEDMERSTAAPWRLVRAVHMAALAVLLAGALALTALSEPETFGAHVLVRNTEGYVGIVAAMATIFGARLSWAPLFALLAIVEVAGRGAGPASAWWTWPAQPSDVDAASWMAAALFIGGLGVYALFGARIERHPDTGSA
jgi:hypothetical protein